MRAPIHSIKHYVQKSLTTVVAAAVNSTDICHAVEPSAVTDVDEIVEGAIVKAIYVEMWVRTNDTSAGTFIMVIVKHPGGVVNPTAANMAALGDWVNKKNILYTTQGLTNVNTSIATPAFKGWIKIPKGKQRFGLDDKMKIHIFAQALDQNICGFFTYKEYT